MLSSVRVSGHGFHIECNTKTPAQPREHIRDQNISTRYATAAVVTTPMAHTLTVTVFGAETHAVALVSPELAAVQAGWDNGAATAEFVPMAAPVIVAVVVVHDQASKVEAVIGLVFAIAIAPLRLSQLQVPEVWSQTHMRCPGVASDWM
jgi:hypothetical protein